MSDLTIADVRRIGQPATVLSRRNAEHWASLVYARRLSPYFTLAAHRLGIGANTLTGIMVFVGLAGAAVFAIAALWSAILGAVVIQLYLVLDCSDGELARIEGSNSARGVFIDRFGHYAVEAGLLIALGARVAAQGEGVWLTLALATAIAAMLIKVQGDLIDSSRAKTGLPALEDVSYDTSSQTARQVRSVLSGVPIHRVFGAIELSLLILVAAVGDSILLLEPTAKTILLIGLAIVAAVGVPARLWVVLRSNRLDP